MKFIIGLIVVSGMVMGLGCDRPAPTGSGGPRQYPYKVLTTVAMVSDIVRNVAGDKAQVTGLMGEGIDPHLYQPSRDDIVALRNADIVFYNGLMLEGKLQDTLVSTASAGKPVHPVTKLIEPKYLMDFEGGHYDPHVWMDPNAWGRATQAVADTLSEFDPPNKDFYQANAAAYVAKLQKLDAYAKEAIATIPSKSRVLITAHDAFNYFGRAYGIEVMGIQGISTESEAAVRDIERLVNLIVERDVKAVFVESSVNDKNVRALVEGAQARGKNISVGGQLFSDAMGTAGTYEGTYIGMIDHNVTIIVKALGGKAPEKGMDGKLK